MSATSLKDGVVSGILLGDGCLSSQKKAIRLEHTLPQLAYLRFKVNLLGRLGFNCRLYNNTKKRTNLGIYEYCAATANGNDVGKYYHLPLKSLLDKLNPLGLLLWWLDDGSLIVHQKKNGSISRFGYLNTQSYGLEGNELIQSFLLDKFGLETTIHIDSKSGVALHDHYRLYLNATNVRRLIDIVREFINWIPVNMRYKFNMKYVVNRRKDSLEMATRYNF